MPKADPQRPFVHLDVQTAYSAGGTSPSLPEDYVRALARQHPLNADTPSKQRIYLTLADYGLHPAVKTAVACQRAGVEHITGLRVRVVTERSFRPWAEQPRMIWTPAGAYDLPVLVFVSCACAVAATPTRRESPVPTSSKINCPPLPSKVGKSHVPAVGTVLPWMSACVIPPQPWLSPEM